MAGIDLDPHEFLKRIDLASGVAMNAARKQLHLNGLNLEMHAKNLTALDEGTLTSSGSTTRPELKRGAWEVAVGFNASYAAEVHETMEPAIGATKRRGEGTKAKATATSSRFGVAGGKYLERPLLGMRRAYTKAIAKAVKKRLR